MDALLMVVGGAALGAVWVVLGPLKRWVQGVPGSNEDFIHY